MGIKRALTVGINYPGTEHSLRGCVNDTLTVIQMLKRYGFNDSDITVLTDLDATTARMKEELWKLVEGVVPGDTIFFHYSGHGSQMRDDSDADVEPDGLDEIICPMDFDWRDNVIRDDDLKRIFDCVPNGVNLTVLLDCCNSGGGMDHEAEYQYDLVEDRSLSPAMGAQSRYLEPPADVKVDLLSRSLPPKTRVLSREIDHTGLMVSGCQAQQTSADAFIGGKYQGACTYFVNQTLLKLGDEDSYVNVVEHLNRSLADAGFTQRPQLDGPVKLHEKSWLQEYSFGEEAGEVVSHTVEVVEAPIVVAPAPQPTVVVLSKPEEVVEQSTTVVITNTPTVKPDKDDDDDDKKKKMLMIGGVIAVIVAVIFFMNQ